MSTNLTETDAFDRGVAVADAGGDQAAAVATLQEAALAGAWITRIDEAREHDESAYKQLARDRMYARGDTVFGTKVNVIGSYIDTWVSLLYARNPDVDCTPDESAGQSTLAAARMFGKTAQIVVSKQWRKTRLKTQAKQWVRAALTSKIGWLKITWQERQGFDPTTERAIADMQDNLRLVQEKIKELEGSDAPSLQQLDLRKEELRLAIDGLKSHTEKAISKGIVCDPVDMADITVSPDCPNIGRYLESPWISHRTFIRLEAAKALFPRLTPEDWKKAMQYSPKKPDAQIANKSGAETETTPDMVDAYKVSEAVRNEGKGGLICAEEIWDRDTNQVIVIVRGIKKYAREPKAPYPGTSRFYPFFGLTFTEVDGSRWAQSLNERSQSLQDAYSRIISQLETIRKRIKPKTMFQAGMMEPGEADKLNNAADQEMVAIKTTNPKTDLRGLIVPVTYAAIDQWLFDVSLLMTQFELVWGLQEAMTAQIQTAKTATEADIEQSGTTSRTGSKRDDLEEVLSDIAQHFLEIDIQCMEMEDVQTLAGPEAFWPQGENGEKIDIEELDRLAQIKVRAGSSGKPNTNAQREAWAQIEPLFERLINAIATLRMADPIALSNCLEELLTETAARSGENIDMERFIPQPGQPLQLVDPTTGQMVLAYPAPQQPGAPGEPGADGSVAPPDPAAAAAAAGAPVPDGGFPA
jgi:hypothetical protein